MAADDLGRHRCRPPDRYHPAPRSAPGAGAIAAGFGGHRLSGGPARPDPPPGGPDQAGGNELVQTVAHAYTQQSQHSQRHELILAHLPLVRHAIGRLRAKCPRGIDLENLEAAGVLGLVEAANRFEPQRGTRFETFAYLRIRGAILDELRRNCPLPQQLLERIARVRAAYKQLPPPVTVEQLAQATGFSADEVSECLAAVRLTRAVSWDDLVGASPAVAA